jgi:hypothetical protein
VKEFKDDQGRPWLLALTVNSALRVKDLVTVEVEDEEAQPDGGIQKTRRTVPLDLVDLTQIHRTLPIIRQQFSTLGQVLYAILVKQVEDRKMTKEEFLDGLRGESLDAAASALESEIIDFFPSRPRQMVALTAAKLDELTSQVLGAAVKQMETLDVAALSGTQSGRPPESSASTLANGHSVSSSPQETPA